MSGIDAKSDAIYQLVAEGSAVRAARDRFHLHRGADLAPGGAGAVLLRHAGRRPAEGHARRSGHRGQEPVVQVQRDDARGRPQPARLRARHELARARAARRRARDARVPLRGQVPEQPERRHRPLGRDDLLHRPVVRPVPRLRHRARARARLAGRLPDPARRRPGRARAGDRAGRVRHAERALLLARRVAALRQRHAAGAHQGVRRRRPTARCRTGGCSSRASGRA